MKKHILLLLTVTVLLFSFKSEAQITPLDSLPNGAVLTTLDTFILWHDVSKEIHPDYLDTIGCTMLVTNDLQLAAFSIKGYEVRKCHPYYSSWNGGFNEWLIDYSLDYYLDNSKQKLSDNTIV